MFPQTCNLESLMEANSLKHVRFPAEIREVREVERIEDKSFWYAKRELLEFRSVAKEAFEQAKEKDCSEMSEQGERGLESFSNPMLGMARRRQRQRVINAVMIAQEIAQEQRKQNKKFDAQRFLAAIASKESAKARKFALMMGKADENAVYHRKRRQMSRLAAQSA
mmetsp:Transcript_15731/g.23830  ORF Transcript_15731/g.23830 Transcript_15731/m.23830 type:complete len:166 (-) Transcript_15731:61-558(-)